MYFYITNNPKPSLLTLEGTNMKHDMNEPTFGSSGIGYILTAGSWLLGFIGISTLSIIPIILSSAASTMAIIHYYYQIKKNKTP